MLLGNTIIMHKQTLINKCETLNFYYYLEINVHYSLYNNSQVLVKSYSTNHSFQNYEAWPSVTL